MAVITSGKTFANGEQLSASKLNQVITAATFNQSDAVDGSTMTLIGGAMTVADGGIATAKIADSAVTKAKIENVANMKALGNTSGSAASPQEVAILDENDMSTDSDTSLATQQSIKAYVDTTAAPTVGFTPTSYTGGESVTLPNGLIMKFGTVTVSGDTNTAVNFGAAFNATVSAQLTIEENTTTDRFPLKVASLSTSVLTIRNSQSDSLTAHWLAFGR
jgi:hypothetical protein